MAGFSDASSFAGTGLDLGGAQIRSWLGQGLRIVVRQDPHVPARSQSERRWNCASRVLRSASQRRAEILLPATPDQVRVPSSLSHSPRMASPPRCIRHSEHAVRANAARRHQLEPDGC